MLDECEKVATAYIKKYIRIVINNERTNFTTEHHLETGTEISFDGTRYDIIKSSGISNNTDGSISRKLFFCHDIKAIHED